jgi:hypothetical protein
LRMVNISLIHTGPAGMERQMKAVIMVNDGRPACGKQRDRLNGRTRRAVAGPVRTWLIFL